MIERSEGCQAGWLMSATQATLEAEIGKRQRIDGQRSHLQNVTRAKWTGGVAQSCLICKHKALSSNSSPTKQKKGHEGHVLMKD
jgi:hypothetical protein